MIVANQAKALSLRKDGKTYDEIAEALGCSLNTARKWVKDAHNLAIESLREDVVEYRELEMARLDRLFASHWEAAIQGSIKDGDFCLRVIAQRAKMMGAEKAPEGSLMEGHVHFHGMSKDEIFARARQMGIPVPAALLPPPPAAEGPPSHDSTIPEAEVVVEGRPFQPGAEREFFLMEAGDENEVLVED
jgi:hypothetical protein